MKPNFYKSFALSALLTCSLTSVAEASGNYEIRAFYGDKVNDEVVVIDLKEWTFSRVTTEGKTPYPVDQAGYLDKVYAITRGSSSMDIIDADTLENLGLLPLNHKPRSGESYNSKLGLALIAGADKPLTSVIDVMSDTVVAEAGKDIFTTPENGDNGGTISSGHPGWLTKDRFVVIDRANRKMQLWGIEKRQHRYGYRHGDTYGQDNGGWHAFFINEIETPTSVHHILHRNTSMLPEDEQRVFYALAEGKNTLVNKETKDDLINPAILELTLSEKDGQLSLTNTIDVPGDTPAVMKSHHADFHPDGQHIYVGSTEGNLFVLDKDTGELISTIATGKGTGHTRFVPARKLAIVTNHDDDFVTVIDTESHTLRDTIKFDKLDFVNAVPEVNQIKQSHTSYVSPDNMYYYAFASAYGIFFEIDLSKEKLEITNTLYTDGVPVQGSFLNSDYFSSSATHSSSGM
ncbi:MAG: hypothetical protein GQ583_09955 [Methyloprofundus sp.]|nr:hypothetical protein [Methyloprofundus sp.]